MRYSNHEYEPNMNKEKETTFQSWEIETQQREITRMKRDQIILNMKNNNEEKDTMNIKKRMKHLFSKHEKPTSRM